MIRQRLEELVVFLAFGGEPNSLMITCQMYRGLQIRQEGGRWCFGGLGGRNTLHGRLGFQGEGNRSSLVLSK